VKVVADTLGVARSNLIAQMQGPAKPRGRYRRQGDDELMQAIRQLTDRVRPTVIGGSLPCSIEPGALQAPIL
jgi:hypothetical protein